MSVIQRGLSLGREPAAFLLRPGNAESIDGRAIFADAGNCRTGDSGCRQVVDKQRLGLGEYNKPGRQWIFAWLGRQCPTSEQFIPPDDLAVRGILYLCQLVVRPSHRYGPASCVSPP